MRHLPYDRAQRIADEIRRVMAAACYNELSDPRLKGVEITYVKMTKDLQIARAYYYLRDADEKKYDEVKRGLRSAAGFFKRIIGEEMKLCYTPAVEFFRDETVDLEEKINAIMTKRGGDQ